MSGQPNDEKKAELLASFASVTGVTDADRSKFYMEAAGWNLDLAITSFYEESEYDDAMSAPHIDPVPAPRDPTPPRGVAKSTGPARAPTGQSRIASLNTLRHDTNSSEDEEEGQAYYAGGSERGGGQQIIGPAKRKGETGKLVDNMFKAAKERGAEGVDPAASSNRAAGTSSFGGTAYRLGDSAGPSVRIGSDVPMGGAASRQVDVVLHFWRNGFSLDDGPLRDFSSQENQEFLNSIRSGEIPRELLKNAHGAEVNLSMEDHRQEDFVQKKAAVQSFSGEGFRLGSPTDAVSAPALQPGQQDQSAARLTEAAEAVHVDSSAPVTNIQIRLTDGSRLVSKFNTSHTVADVRRFITIARPEYSSHAFTLMTSFPNKELTNESQSLADGGLLNAVLIVKTSK